VIEDEIKSTTFSFTLLGCIKCGELTKPERCFKTEFGPICVDCANFIASGEVDE